MWWAKQNSEITQGDWEDWEDLKISKAKINLLKICFGILSDRYRYMLEVPLGCGSQKKWMEGAVLRC